MNTDSDSHMR